MLFIFSNCSKAFSLGIIAGNFAGNFSWDFLAGTFSWEVKIDNFSWEICCGTFPDGGRGRRLEYSGHLSWECCWVNELGVLDWNAGREC